MEDRQRTLDSPIEKIMLSMTAFADEMERDKARQRTYDAMQRKAKAGHVTDGRVFGYDNVEVLSASGERSHVNRVINEGESAVVRRIFELSAGGRGTHSDHQDAQRRRRDHTEAATRAAEGVGNEQRSRGATATALPWRNRLEPNGEARQVVAAKPEGSTRGRMDADRSTGVADRVRGSVAGRALAVYGSASPSRDKSRKPARSRPRGAGPSRTTTFSSTTGFLARSSRSAPRSCR